MVDGHLDAPAELRRGQVAGDRQQRRAIEEGVAHAGRQVGGAGSQRGETESGGARHPSHDVGRERRRALVGGEHVREPADPHRLEQRKDVAAGDPEAVAHAGRAQRLDDEVRVVHRVDQYSSNMRWTSSTSSVRVRASMASTRAFWGFRLSATTNPARAARCGAGRAAPGPAREHDQDAAPARLLERLALGRRRHARGERRRDDRPGARGHEGPDGRAVGAGVRRRDVHARELGAPAHVELRRRRVAPHRPAVDGDASVRVGVAEHADVRAAEGLEPEGGRLGDLAGGLDLVVQQHQHAEPARGRARRRRARR